MTCGDIIAKVDALEPNQYGTTQKLEWLSILDGQVINEQIVTHEFPPGCREAMHWPDPFGRDGRPCRREPFPPQSGMPGPGIWENRPICAPPPPPEFPCACGEKKRKAVISESSEWTEEDEENYIRYGDGTCEIPDGDEEEEDGDKMPPPPKPPYTSESDELLIRDPYGSEIYQHWLQAKIASENAEITKYNQQMLQYNAAYSIYANWINSNFLPRRPRGGSRFHY